MSPEMLLKMLEKLKVPSFKFKGYVFIKRVPINSDSRGKNERCYFDKFESSFVDEIISKCQGKFVELDLPYNVIWLEDRLRAYKTGCLEFTTKLMN